MKLMNNKVALSALALIAVAVAYYLVIYLPKQQEISLRKQTYELCEKELNQFLEANANILAKKANTGEISEDQLHQATLQLALGKNKFITDCIEKRLQEYKK